MSRRQAMSVRFRRCAERAMMALALSQTALSSALAGACTEASSEILVHNLQPLRCSCMSRACCSAQLAAHTSVESAPELQSSGAPASGRAEAAQRRVQFAHPALRPLPSCLGPASLLLVNCLLGRKRASRHRDCCLTRRVQPASPCAQLSWALSAALQTVQCLEQSGAAVCVHYLALLRLQQDDGACMPRVHAVQVVQVEGCPMTCVPLQGEALHHLHSAALLSGRQQRSRGQKSACAITRCRAAGKVQAAAAWLLMAAAEDKQEAGFAPA